MTDSVSVMIQVKGVSKHVQTSSGRLDILNDISFTIPRGQTVAITGSSGSGKTTLLGIMAGLDQASSGAVWLGEHNLSQLNEDGRARLRARHVGFVFQSFQLIPHMSALENVLLPLELKGVTQAKSLAQEFLMDVGLSERLHHFPNQLSGGEQQRVALARAFITRPDVLFADEPTGNLDYNTGTLIADLLFKLNQENGTTLVLVTHEEKLANRCDGRLHLVAGCLAAKPEDPS